MNALTRPQWELACIVLDAPQFVDRMEEIAESHELYREFIRACEPWLSQNDVAGVIEKAREKRIPATPIGNGQTLLEFEQLRSRDFYVEGALGGYEEPGFPHRLSATPPTRRRPAPRLDTAGKTVPQWDERHGDPLGVPVGNESTDTLPLKGLRVLDLGTFWAAPYAAMYLASLGAEVTKIEAPMRPDAFRFVATSLKMGERWYECGPLYQATNLGKQGITLDLSSPEGQGIFRTLVEQSDVVIENFTPRVMEKWGFDDAGLRAIRPDLIYIRTPGFGLTGPRRDAVGWALVIEQAAGMSWLVGDPDQDPPRNPGGFFDPAVGMHLSLVIQAALAHHRRTGEGQMVEIAQLELGVSMTAESVIDYSLNGRVQNRRENRPRNFAPQGVYECADGEWVAISAPGQVEWEALVEGLGRPAFSEQARFQTPAARLEAAADLDESIAVQARLHPSGALADALRKAGVPAAVVLVSAGMYGDPQLVASDYFQTMQHPDSGERHYPTWPMRMSFLPRHCHLLMAPTLGEHNQSVLSRRLAMDPEAIAHLRKAGIIAERLPSA